MKLDEQDSAMFNIVTHEFKKFIKTCESKIDLSTEKRRTIFEQTIFWHTLTLLFSLGYDVDFLMEHVQRARWCHEEVELERKRERHLKDPQLN